MPGLFCGHRGYDQNNGRDYAYGGILGLTGFERYYGYDPDCDYWDCGVDKFGNSDYCYDPTYVEGDCVASPVNMNQLVQSEEVMTSTDSAGDGCDWYASNPGYCDGTWDNKDF